MTQQPNQNYPQPGGWGQQQPAQQPGGWGQQQPAQQGGQWGGAQQPQYGQAQPAQQQYGGGASYAGGTAGSGGTTWGKVWGFYAAGGLAVVAAIGVFLAWASFKISLPAALGGQSQTTTISAIAKVSTSKGGDSGTAKDVVAIWGWLLLVAAVVAVVGVVLVVVMKTAIAGWVTVGGAGGALLFAVIAAIYFNGKAGDAKKGILAEGLPAGTKYSIGLGMGAYLALGAALIAVVLAVLAQLSINSGDAAASATPAYNQQAYPQQGYQQPAGYAQPGQPAQQGYQAPQQGQQAQQPPQGGWGQPQPPQGQQAPQQAPQQGQQQWGNPQPPQQGQQQWGGYDPAANQPTQAVQPGYMPGQQQPPQQQ